MLLIHDIVEIDAGDTFLYSTERKNAYNKDIYQNNTGFKGKGDCIKKFL